MGKLTKKSVKLVGATMMSVFSLASVFAATYAWFAMNTEVEASGMSVKVARLNGRLQNIYFHAFDRAFVSDDPDDKQKHFLFEKDPFATYEYDWDKNEIDTGDDDESIWNLGEYSYIDRDHCLLIIFEFDKDYTSTTEGDIFVKGITKVGGDAVNTTYSQTGEPLETTGGGYLGARTSTGIPYYSLPQTEVNEEGHEDRILMKKVPMTDEQGNPVLDKQGNPRYYDYYALSSVASFSYRTFDNSGYTSFLKANPGTTLDFATSTLGVGNSFTTIKNDTNKYVFDQSPYLYKSNGSETVKYIAIIVNYSPEAISYIYSTYLGDSGLNSYDSILRFACDWRYEVY